MPEPAARLSDLWSGRAYFRHEREIDIWGGRVIVPMDGRWYDFYREWIAAPSEGCGALGGVRVMVRYSTDQGRTWTRSRVVAEPIPGHPTMGCNIVDGDAYFDEESQTWHLLAQCIGPTGGWRMCHYSRGGRDPYGAFDSDGANPVVAPGQLWQDICAGGDKVCGWTSPQQGTMEAGTPDILYKRNGYYYVTFHGAANAAQDAFTGVAKTRDFRNWITTEDLPNDAILYKGECESWNPGCAGWGAAFTIEEDGYHYLLGEAPQYSIGCAPGQNWYFGLVRARGFPRAGSGGWEIFSRNPMITHPPTEECLALQYASIFRDEDGSYWLTYEERPTSRLHKLVFGNAAHPVMK